MGDYTRPPRVGTVVRFCPTPASLALYTERPRTNALGQVTTVAGPGGPMSHLRGPGGGLVYVDWEGVRVLGVALGDLCRAKMPTFKFLVVDESGRGDRGVTEVKAISEYWAIRQAFPEEWDEWIDLIEEAAHEGQRHDDPDDTDAFVEWLSSWHHMRVEQIP